MKFGKEFRTHLEETLPEWRDKFLSYKLLKKLLKHISATEGVVLDGQSSSAVVGTRNNQNSGSFDLCGNGGSPGPVINGGGQIEGGVYPFGVLGGRVQNENRPWVGLEEWFVKILDEELDKFNDFFVDKEEEFVIRLQELKERIERVKETSNRSGIFTSESEFSEEMVDIRKDFVTIHGEMVLLKSYSSLNFAGLVKILKKYDKRTGALLRLPFTQRALHQPFFTTEPLTRLLRECEANLELLFPLEAEVVESGPPNEREGNGERNAAETSSSLREGTADIYRSTLAAMRTIQGLRRASSTYNPLSFASFFQGQDDDGAGAVTSEDSASSASLSLQNKENDGEDVQSSKQEF